MTTKNPPTPSPKLYDWRDVPGACVPDLDAIVSAWIDHDEIHRAVAEAFDVGLQRALEEANEMVCRFHMPYGWPDFQTRWGLRTATEVLATPHPQTTEKK